MTSRTSGPTTGAPRVSSRLVVAAATAFLMTMTAGIDSASANLEINGLFDARSGAMGGTGVAFLDSAGAIPTNPAALDLIDSFVLTVDTFLIGAQPQAPYKVSHLTDDGVRYENYETIRSATTWAPLPFLGAAFRFAGRLVIGAAAYPILGQGTTASYKPAPEEFPNVGYDLDMSMGLVEIAVPISIRIFDNLSLGLSWRANYMTQSVKLPYETDMPPLYSQVNEAGEVLYTDLSLSGWNFAGLQVGVLYNPLPNLSVGLSYRSKMVVKGEGTLKLAALTQDVRQDVANPHGFRAGFALTVLDDALLLAADFKYLLYAESWKTTKLTVLPDRVEETPIKWSDAYTAQLGFEYKLGDILRLRLGYALATTSTNPDYALSNMPPPGASHLFTAGVGIQALDDLSIDLAAGYVFIESEIEKDTEYNGGIGIYASHAGEFSLSVTYRL